MWPCRNSASTSGTTRLSSSCVCRDRVSTRNFAGSDPCLIRQGRAPAGASLWRAWTGVAGGWYGPDALPRSLCRQGWAGPQQVKSIGHGTERGTTILLCQERPNACDATRQRTTRLLTGSPWVCQVDGGGRKSELCTSGALAATAVDISSAGRVNLRARPHALVTAGGFSACQASLHSPSGRRSLRKQRSSLFVSLHLGEHPRSAPTYALCSR